MSDLSFFHAPKSVAIVGASDDKDKIGGRPIHYMRELGCRARIYAVNPHRSSAQGLTTYPDLASLPAVPEVAVIAVSGAVAADAVTTCSELGVRGCVVISSGFGETGDPEGHSLQTRMLAAAKETGLRIVGPNSQGLADFRTSTVLSFSTMFTERPPLDGPIGIVSQSGAMSAVPYGVLRQRGLGVRYAHSTGNDIDVTAAELAETVARDPELRLLLLYLEDLRDPAMVERVAAVARARALPIIALVGGRSAAGQRAAASHTGALASEQRVVDAFLERLGIWRVRNSRELTAATELYLQPVARVSGDLAIVSNSGASCVLAADSAGDHGVEIATLATTTRDRLAAVLPRFAAVDNPVDVTSALLTDSGLFGQVLPALAADPDVGTCVLSIPVAGRGYDVERMAADAVEFIRTSDRVLTVVAPQPEVGATFRRHGVPVFDDEDQALAALAQVRRHRLGMLDAADRPDLCRRPAPTGSARTLNEAEGLAWLRDIGIPVVPHVLCREPGEVGAAVASLGKGPFVVKGCTSSVTHKSDLGLVKLGLPDLASAADAAHEVLATMVDHGLHTDGVLVARMVKPAIEVAIGAHLDPVFGPVVLVGRGGTDIEVLPDIRLLLPPFDGATVRKALAELRLAPLLEGVRGAPAVDVDGWVAAAVRLGEAMTRPDSTLLAVDVNPLMLARRGADGPPAVAADAVVVVERR